MAGTPVHRVTSLDILPNTLKWFLKLLNGFKPFEMAPEQLK